MGKIIRCEFDGTEVHFSDEGWLNASEAAAQFGRHADDWLGLPTTDRYMEALARNLSAKQPGRPLAKTDLAARRRGRPGGTWIHPKLVVAFARWLSDDFAAWCDMQIDSVLYGASCEQEQARLRHEAAASFKVMQEILRDSREADGKTTAAHHYANEARLISWAVIGASGKLDRHSLGADELDLLARVEERNAVLIGRGVEYAKRKPLLERFVGEWRAAREPAELALVAV